MYHNILVPISFDEDAKAKDAIEVAKALSADGAKITLLHVMEQVPGYAISYMSQEYMTEALAAIQTELAEMAAPIENGESLVVSGHSGRTILDWAAQNGVDCIVVASHRPGMQDLLIGSTATQIVRHAKCGVHVLR